MHRTHPSSRLAAAAAVLAGALVLPAQTPTARAFLLPDYRNVFFLDLAATRARGVWDELQASVLAMTFGQIEKELGFSLDRLDRITFVQERDVAEVGGMAAGAYRDVRVFEGNAELAPPPWVVGGQWSEERIGGQDVWRRESYRDELFFRPRPELQVFGATEALGPVLTGERGAATPCADVLSLLSGREARLAYAVVHVGHPDVLPQFKQQVLPDAEWGEDAAPAFLCLEVLVAGEPDDPRLAARATLRHATGGAGVAASAAAAERLRERLLGMPEARLVRPVLREMRQSVDGPDVVWQLDLGRARDAVGQLALLLVPMFTARAEVAEVEVGEAPAENPRAGAGEQEGKQEKKKPGGGG